MIYWKINLSLSFKMEFGKGQLAWSPYAKLTSIQQQQVKTQTWDYVLFSYLQYSLLWQNACHSDLEISVLQEQGITGKKSKTLVVCALPVPQLLLTKTHSKHRVNPYYVKLHVMVLLYDYCVHHALNFYLKLLKYIGSRKQGFTVLAFRCCFCRHPVILEAKRNSGQS